MVLIFRHFPRARELAFIFIFSQFSALTNLCAIEPIEFQGIVEAHQNFLKTKADYVSAPSHIYFYLHNLPETIDENARNYFVVSGTELTDIETKNVISNFIRDNPSVTLFIDVRRNDGLTDENGVFALRDTQLPKEVTSLWISNIYQDVISIGDNFLLYVNGLKKINFLPFVNVTSIGDYFISSHVELTELDLSSFSKVTKIGDRFLFNSKNLQYFDLTPFENVTEFGDWCFAHCEALSTIDLTPLKNLKRIGKGFFDTCYTLQTIILAGMSKVEKIGNWFFSCCVRLQDVDLSALVSLKYIGDGFFSGCLNLTQIDLSALKPTHVGFGPFRGCRNLIAVNKPELTARTILSPIAKTMMESHASHLNVYGNHLYKTFVLVLPENLKEVLDGLNLDMICAKVPRSLEDIPDLQGQVLITGYGKLMRTLNAKTSRETKKNYGLFLKNILINLFVNPDHRISWPMYDDNRAELCLAFKHLLVNLQKLSETESGQDEAVSCLEVVISGFAHCPTRQASEMNQIMTKFGIGKQEEQGTEATIWGLINEVKLDMFYAYASKPCGEINDEMDEEEAEALCAHEYAQKFTVVNETIGLPVAMRGFKERIQKLSEIDWQEKEWEFLTEYFTPDKIVGTIFHKLTGPNSPLTAMQLRALIAKLEDNIVLRKYTENLDAYYQGHAGVPVTQNDDDDDVPSWWENNPITIGEVKHLLVLMRALKAQKTGAAGAD